MNTDDIALMIREKIPQSEVTVDDVRGDGRHFAITVVAAEFVGQSRIQQHQAVYKALGACVGEDVHALQITTRTPDEAAPARANGG